MSASENVRYSIHWIIENRKNHGTRPFSDNFPVQNVSGEIPKMFYALSEKVSGGIYGRASPAPDARYFWAASRWWEVSTQLGIFERASVKSRSTCGISMPCGQIVVHLPQAMQADGFFSSGRSSIRIAAFMPGAKRISL